MACCYNDSGTRIKVGGITVTPGTSVVIDGLPQTFDPYCTYTLKICFDLPQDIQGTEPVTIEVDETSYPILTAIGNTLLAGEIRDGDRLRMVYGGRPPHFQLKHGCHCLEYNTEASE